MPEVDRSGEKLERLVTTLEKVLSGTEATIESRCRRLIDRDTGRHREHDILITWDHGHHQLMTAIECRDRSRPIGVPAVEAFADKCSATGVSKGVMVSTSGFRDSARKKAAVRSIICMDLEEVENFEWLSCEFSVVGYTRKFGHMNIQIMFLDDKPKVIHEVRDDQGNVLSERQIIQSVSNAVPLPDDFSSYVEIDTPLNIHATVLNWIVVDSAGREWPVDHLLVETTMVVEQQVGTVKSHRYTGGGKEYAVATSDVVIGDRTGKFVLLRNDDDTTSVYLTF